MTHRKIVDDTLAALLKTRVGIKSTESFFAGTYRIPGGRAADDATLILASPTAIPENS